MQFSRNSNSLFNKVKIDEKGTGEESTLGRRRPNISEGENLVEKIDKSGFGEVKTLLAPKSHKAKHS